MHFRRKGECFLCFDVISCNIEHIIIMNRIKKVIFTLAPFIALITFVLFTNPYKLPLFLLLIPFFLFGIGSFVFLNELSKTWPISNRKRKVLSAILTSILLLGALLQSIRQLSVRDILILLALFVGLSFYLRRLDI